MENDSKKKSGRARKSKPHPVDPSQYDLDQELRIKHALEEDPTEVIEKSAGIVPIPSFSSIAGMV